MLGDDAAEGVAFVVEREGGKQMLVLNGDYAEAEVRCAAQEAAILKDAPAEVSGENKEAAILDDAGFQG